VRAIKDEQQRANALVEVARLLPEPLLLEALEATRTIDAAECRVRVVAELAPQIARISPTTLHSLWRETQPLLTRRARKDLLADLCHLGPMINELGGEVAVAEILRAVQDVGHWWP